MKFNDIEKLKSQINLNENLSESENSEISRIADAIFRKLTALKVFGIKMKTPIVGNVLTQFPIETSLSTPISKLMGKDEDLALAIGVESVEIKRIGNEVVVFVPNKDKKVISFQDALYWYLNRFKDDENYILPILLGQNPSGENSVIELTSQPHVLIAGSTGSGKSIFESNIIASLSMLKSDKELEFYLVDTKTLDLTLFFNLSNVKETARELSEFYSLIEILLGEVEKRNKKLSKYGMRNIGEFNKKVKSGEIINEQLLPYSILMIDEFADLLDRDNNYRREQKQLENDVLYPPILDSIRRLIQICRASGVHVILCTQRTSVDVINGVIKANFPTRISLKVASKIDSRVVLDENGAEKLLGKGDLLLKSGDSDIVQRFHAAYIRIEDVQVILSQRDYIRKGMGLE